MKKSVLYDLLGCAFVLIVLTARPNHFFMGEGSLSYSDSSPDGQKITAVTAPTYEVLDMGIPEDAHHIEPLAISPNGRYVVGYVSTYTIMRAFLWSDGTFHYLSDRQSIANAVNDSGVAVGEYIPDAVRSQAVVWQKGEGKPLFKSQIMSYASAIDNQGNIYGQRNAQEGNRSYIRTPKGTITDLDTGSANSSYVMAVSQNKQVALSLVNRSSRDAVSYKAAVWKNNELHELLPFEEGKRCYPLAINDKGIVVGSTTQESAAVPVMWKEGKPVVLNVPHCHSGTAVGINNAGSIVLTARIDNQNNRTSYLLYKKKLFAIQDLVRGEFPIERPLKIAENGVILAEGNVNRIKHGFLLVPK